MNDRQGQQEPTMEEILASIRRIISDDEKSPEDNDKTEPAPAPKAARKAVPAERREQDEEKTVEPFAAQPEQDETPEDAGGDEPPGSDIADEDDVLELTEVVNEDGSVVSLKGDTEGARAAADQAGGTGLLSESTAESTASAFASLAGAVSAARGVPIGGAGRTLEEMVKELLRPMLKQWLDDNLPALVERLVEKEIAKLARRAEDAHFGDED